MTECECEAVSDVRVRVRLRVRIEERDTHSAQVRPWLGEWRKLIPLYKL